MYWPPQTIYPNQYIILIGPSGRSRKGEAINLAFDIVRSLDLSFGSSSMTREALIRTFIDSEKSFTDETTSKPKSQCAIYCISPELSVFLGQRDIKFLADLTDWYDSKDVWDYMTVSRGNEQIHGVCFNLLGATAPDWLSSIFPSEAVGGGFTSRCVLVVERNKGKIVADPTILGIDYELRDKLIHDLRLIQSLSGEFRFTDEAKQEYVQWYEDQERKLVRGISPVKDSRFSGYVSRRATHIKKVCMAISASRSGELIINKSDFIRAKSIILAVEKNMASSFENLGEGRFTKQIGEIITFIKAREKTTRSEILNRFYNDVDSWTFERIENLLRQMKVIITTELPDQADRAYEWKGDREETAILDLTDKSHSQVDDAEFHQNKNQ